MKKHHLLVGVTAAFLAATTGATYLNTTTPTVSSPTEIANSSSHSAHPSAATSTSIESQDGVPCDPTLWNHVYKGHFPRAGVPDRLTVIDPCKTVTGTIYSIKAEADGDFHIRLSLDPGQESLLNAKNISGQLGKLVLEPVCQNPDTQADAISACAGFQGTIQVPPVGSHVAVTGSYVLDNEHGWRELHPLSAITRI